MCGIAGVLGRVYPEKESLETTRALMANRGPDTSGLFISSLRGEPLTLVHSRLSIIDLDPRADQPFERDGLVLVFNGEIYNYRELRAELEDKGTRFETESDTEVIAEGYRCWGTGCFDRFEGMWALALLDLDAGRLVLSRDRFGEKPLYYTLVGGRLFFASETRFLRALGAGNLRPNLDQVRRFLVNGYKSLHKQPSTFFDGVGELPPGTYAVLEGPEVPQPRTYWELKPVEQLIDAREARAEAARLVREALRLRLRADVPIAFCLSGGVDSSTLVALAAREMGQDVHAFSIYDDDERYDESVNADAVVAAIGCHHDIVRPERSGFIERLTRLISYNNAPVATISFYIQSFLADLIKEAGYKVAITGNGADELFTGYYDHYNFWLAAMNGRPGFDGLVAEWRKSYGAFVRNPVLKDPLCFVEQPDRRDHIYLNRDVFNDMLVEPLGEDFVEAEAGGGLLRRRMLNEIHYETLPVLLGETDLTFMRTSIENRTPYLDRRLADFLFSLPAELLIRDGYPKWLLREAARGVVPDQVRLDRRKRGFNVPLSSMIDLDDPKTREWVLTDGPIFELVDRERFIAFVDQADERNSFSKFLFSFLSSRVFLELP